MSSSADHQRDSVMLVLTALTGGAAASTHQGAEHLATAHGLLRALLHEKLAGAPRAIYLHDFEADPEGFQVPLAKVLKSIRIEDDEAIMAAVSLVIALIARLPRQDETTSNLPAPPVLEPTVSEGVANAVPIISEPVANAVSLAPDTPPRGTESVELMISVDHKAKVATITGADGVGRRVPFLAPYRPTYPRYVGRGRLLSAIKRRLLAGERAVGLTFLPGVGKSAAARQLAWDDDLRHHFVDGVLWAGLGLRPNLPALLTEWAQALAIDLAGIGESYDVTGLMNVLRDALIDRRMLLVIDDAWDVNETRTFLLGGPRCTHLISARQRHIIEQCGVTEMVVEALDEHDALELMHQIAPNVMHSQQDDVHTLLQMIDGLPQGIILLGNYLADAGRTRREDWLRTAVRRLHDVNVRLNLEQQQSKEDRRPSLDADLPISLRAVIQISFDVLKPAILDGLCALTVFRPKPATFTSQLAREIAGVDPTTLRILVEHGLLEHIPPDRYALYNVIAECAQQGLATDAIGDLHEKAVAYYQRVLSDYNEQSAPENAYKRWYRYEHPDWQETKVAWLYHLSHLPDRIAASRQFALVFFEAFWWWGCYIEAPFCRHLLVEWRWTQTTDFDQAVQKCLADFFDSYPGGYRKHGQGDWDQVETALIRLRQILSIDGEPLDLIDATDQHLRALTSIFLAHAYRYRDTGDQRADACYQEARAIFQQDADNQWNVAWILYEQGDLWLERDRPVEARRCCIEAITMASVEEDWLFNQDCEVIANAHRALADTARRINDQDNALLHYQWATLFAYAFQGVEQPDPYTLAFYREMRDRLTDWFAECAQTGRSTEIARLCAGLQAFWEPVADLVTEEGRSADIDALIAAGAWERLAGRLLPVEPEETLLHDLDYCQEFANRVRKTVGFLHGHALEQYPI